MNIADAQEGMECLICSVSSDDVDAVYSYPFSGALFRLEVGARYLFLVQSGILFGEPETLRQPVAGDKLCACYTLLRF